MRYARVFGANRRRLAIVATVVVAAVVAPVVLASTASKVKTTTFSLFPNTGFVNCLKGSGSPTASVTVDRGKLADKLTLNLANFKPGLDFDLFTVQNSNQLANGNPDPNFTNFGFAWYQSDVHVAADGTSKTIIKTILLDQIFGFDPAVSLGPTNTFHVGFWFNNPADAASCGFTGSTPFNGEHNAGPLAFISRPNAVTGLGPLCTDPNGSPPPACNP
jgi:hypothetical protein